MGTTVLLHWGSHLHNRLASSEKVTLTPELQILIAEKNANLQKNRKIASWRTLEKNLVSAFWLQDFCALKVLFLQFDGRYQGRYFLINCSSELLRILKGLKSILLLQFLIDHLNLPAIYHRRLFGKTNPLVSIAVL